MGVSGCGKTTIGQLLSSHLNLPFFDGDNFHPEINIKKMSSGIPLTDEDRLPWLTSLSENLTKWELTGGAVLACSALKEYYRQILLSSQIPVTWVFLDGNMDIIKQRLDSREGHYMPSTLLSSQFGLLERPQYGIHVNISSTPELIVQEILKKLKA
ncbi:6-phosphogluconate dehydrogenase [Sporocytophaga myxococcoides]|uniref:Gluconokinase n=1 Tax=Sporocytophaga myxococcoides TaxID=153721 RepID=A0A098LJB9_9BACT|nr:gluconokinase [Sporocytophaga myxococcoides]GAL86492.1 6-phosphogluconate dehydrogenase [Sporocytophaga myxococcoides]